ncbi:glycosyltransferase family 2 protein [Bradyrhizobium sp. WSM1743]|uniref:glycosyltransferase n=1 Tax=Bradyrhizobium sp. WSM1743 TaxID=318996 RepID=UPI000422B088|nr:glycosyltransferase [Bradyrhizobium sp. WSM1743]
MLISIIIPHLNQEDHLRVGLEALHAQRGVTSDVEIIVVDNGSARLPDKICSAWPDVQLLLERIPGPGPARNRGIREARGRILAFIDADCRADSGWLSAIETALTDGTTTIIGGDVRVGYEHPSRPTFLEPYESIYSYRNNEHIAEGFSGTGNLATLRSVLAKVGPFAGIEVAEDRDWGLRARAAGYAIRYVPEMIVFHPARKTFAELRRKWDRHIAHDYERIRPQRLGALRFLARAIAVAGSPIFELKTVVSSPRVSGSYQRILALLCLIAIRLYRGGRMVGVLLRGDGRQISGEWNRTQPARQEPAAVD